MFRIEKEITCMDALISRRHGCVRAIQGDLKALMGVIA